MKVYSGLSTTDDENVLTGSEIPDPSTIDANGDNEGGILLFFQTDEYTRKRGFKIEWEVQTPTTTPGPPTKKPKPPKG